MSGDSESHFRLRRDCGAKLPRSLKKMQSGILETDLPVDLLNLMNERRQALP
jgi:hypothetical protein